MPTLTHLQEQWNDLGSVNPSICASSPTTISPRISYKYFFSKP